MSEALFGYAEAAFAIFGLIFLGFLVLRLFHPRNKKAMEDHGKIPFKNEED